MLRHHLVRVVFGAMIVSLSLGNNMTILASPIRVFRDRNEVYIVDENPFGRLGEYELTRNVHDHTCRIKSLDIATGEISVIGDVDFSMIGRIVDYVGDEGHGRLFVQDYYPGENQYRWWVVDVNKKKVLRKLPVISRDSLGKLFISPDGKTIAMDYSETTSQKDPMEWKNKTIILSGETYGSLHTPSEYWVGGNGTISHPLYSDDSSLLYAYGPGRNLVTVSLSNFAILDTLPLNGLAEGNRRVGPDDLQNEKILLHACKGEGATLDCYLFTYDLGSKKTSKKINTFPFGESYLSPDGGMIVFVPNRSIPAVGPQTKPVEYEIYTVSDGKLVDRVQIEAAKASKTKTKELQGELGPYRGGFFSISNKGLMLSNGKEIFRYNLLTHALSLEREIRMAPTKLE
ncbi:MAG: hypothetical protein LAO21_03655 [Acidobacteriia bacterium]|nr:hypothetical protein [Terriglobia bacterium]